MSFIIAILNSGYVPKVVFQSQIFWIAMALMIIGILIYHNYFRKGSERQTNRSKSFTKTSTGEMQLRYTNEGRSGRVHYQSKEAEFSMYYEFGGGDCVAWIDVPSMDDWRKVTGLPIERRDEVLNAIGKQVASDQVSSGKGYYKIEGNAINIYG